jgi:hypothetical protein
VTDDDLFPLREMRAPCLALLAVSVLGFILGHGLDILFRR